jgi:transmembrane protein EpsG
MYLYEGFSAIRQGLAIAMLTYALHYVGKKGFWYYFRWVVLASLFHLITAFLFLIAYPLVRIKLNKNIAIVAVVVLFFLVQFTPMAEKVFTIAATIFPKYEWYLNNMQYAGAAKTSFGLFGPLVKISIVLPIIYAQDHIVKKFPKALPVVNFAVLYIVSYIFHLKISIFGRVEHAFVFAYILAIVYFSLTFKKYSRILIIGMVGFFYYLMFIRYIANGTLDVDNDVYVNPYQTIIFK